ncbi:Transmembrane amino acid transporter family protein [Ophiocordyceps camponoti-floridani]|uniref:Transmembrane amino acid transporter family protein n=1 Tax=Ophiocordyceps camponoti-floridani TaxID=2030778 RepID=A0A8H4Q3I8_9HYPO|nr:Transmembrane amino acid transporter family protein [Ophiocordyceps camponoti-floridani]
MARITYTASLFLLLIDHPNACKILGANPPTIPGNKKGSQANTPSPETRGTRAKPSTTSVSTQTEDEEDKEKKGKKALGTEAWALVTVTNESNSSISSVTVTHKHSNKHKAHKTWEEIASHEKSPENDALNVTYRVGAGAIGADWWMVSWMQDDEPFVSSPDNMRWLADWVERGAQKTLATAVSVAVCPVGAPFGLASPLRKATKALLDRLVPYLLNDEKTDGYKGHMLKARDQTKVTEIIVTDDGLEFVSPSGKSRVKRKAVVDTKCDKKKEKKGGK